jgi:hypothetical protein
MEFYPLGSLPTSYPSWYVEALAQAGLNAYASATYTRTPRAFTTSTDHRAAACR